MNKELERKRLFIFLGITFTISWIPMILLDCSGFKWDGTRPYMESLAGLVMLCPAIAHILTRWLTKEEFAVVGQDSMMLGITFKDKKWKYFLFAMLIPWLITEISCAITLFRYPDVFDADYLSSLGMDSRIAYIYPLVMIINGSVINFAAFGEEFGWRGYMMPKMIKLWGTKPAIIAGGIIWGIWHAPLTVAGHNFGTDYPGFPFVGIAIMCLFCTFIGMMLTYVTIKSGSIWPAAIMHAVTNSKPSVLMCFINNEKLADMIPNSLGMWTGLLIPTVVIGTVCMIMLCKKAND